MKQQELEKNFDKLCIRYGIERNEILELYKKYLEKAGNDDKAYRLMLVDLNREYGSHNSSLKPYYIYVVGESGLMDAVETKHKPHSIAIGCVDQYGTPLDYREKLYGKIDNPQFGKPYEKPEYEREIYCLISESQDFIRCSFAKLVARDDVAENLELKCWKFYKTRASYSARKSLVQSYNLTKNSKFIEISSQKNPYELVSSLNVLSISDALRVGQTAKDLKQYEQHVTIVKGILMSSSKEAREDSKVLGALLGDEDGNSIFVMFPKFFKINVEAGSDLVVFGTFTKLRDSIAMYGVGYLVGEIAILPDAR